MKLLIVDDERIPREGLKKQVRWKECGIDVVETADSGITALKIAKQFCPDIVISDVRMPEMSGIEFAVKIKALFPHIYLIFLSGYADKEYLKAAIKLQAVDYVEKPIDIKEIEAVVCRCVKKIASPEAFKDIELANTEQQGVDTVDFVKSRASLSPYIQDVIDYLSFHYAEPIDTTSLAARVGLSMQYLSCLFRTETGKHMTTYLAELRVENAKIMLKNRRSSFSQIAEQCGFSDQNYFTKVFKKVTGMTPSQYRNTLL